MRVSFEFAALVDENGCGCCTCACWAPRRRRLRLRARAAAPRVDEAFVPNPGTHPPEATSTLSLLLDDVFAKLAAPCVVDNREDGLEVCPTPEFGAITGKRPMSPTSLCTVMLIPLADDKGLSAKAIGAYGFPSQYEEILSPDGRVDDSDIEAEESLVKAGTISLYPTPKNFASLAARTRLSRKVAAVPATFATSSSESDPEYVPDTTEGREGSAFTSSTSSSGGGLVRQIGVNCVSEPIDCDIEKGCTNGPRGESGVATIGEGG